MAKGPKVTHPEYIDFNSDEDDLLGEDDLLNDKTSDVSYNELASNHESQDELFVNATREIEHLTQELNTLKLAHETQQEDHRELLRTHEKLRFEKLNLEQEHEFLKAINDDLRKKSSSYIAKQLLLSTFMPQIKSKQSHNKNKKGSTSSGNNKANMYTAIPPEYVSKHKLGSVYYLLPGLATINTILRYTLMPKSGDDRMIRGYSIDMLQHIDGCTNFNVMDLIVETVKRTTADQKRSCGYAPYIQMLINSKVGNNIYLLDREHLPLQPELEDCTVTMDASHPSSAVAQEQAEAARATTQLVGPVHLLQNCPRQRMIK